MPNTIYISHVIDAPIEKVWGVMRDFNAMPSYHPGILKSAIEGNGPSDQIGCVRRLTLAEGFVREVLLLLDDRNYAFTYEIIEGTLPVRGYVAGVRLHRVTDGNRTFAEWWADFEVVGRGSRRDYRADREQRIRGGIQGCCIETFNNPSIVERLQILERGLPRGRAFSTMLGGTTTLG